MPQELSCKRGGRYQVRHVCGERLVQARSADGEVGWASATALGGDVYGRGRSREMRL